MCFVLEHNYLLKKAKDEYRQYSKAYLPSGDVRSARLVIEK